MQLFNTRNTSEIVSLEHAIFEGLAANGGLFMPQKWNPLPREHVFRLLDLPFLDQSSQIATHFLAEIFSRSDISAIISRSFSFPIITKSLSENMSVLELFHGPTLAFKDFGANFMANIMSEYLSRQKSNSKNRVTILTATSGDTGAAVANAFKNIPNITVHILYPKNRISILQEKLFCTLGGNIHTYAVEGTFNHCQALVKEMFCNEKLKKQLNLTSANSINVGRLLGQVFYHFEAAAAARGRPLVVSVPSGNFGNLTAGILAQKLGAPIHRFVAATNANDTIPRYLETGEMRPLETISTLSNAMDVSLPNNWERIETLFNRNFSDLRTNVSATSVSDALTKETIAALSAQGYVACPHTAVAIAALQKQLAPEEFGVVLSTAHPAKFLESMECILQRKLPVPEAIAKVQNSKLLSQTIPNSIVTVEKCLLKFAP